MPLVHNPKIRQARGEQQATEPRWLTEMAFMDLEPAAFLVREKGLDFLQLVGAVLILGGAAFGELFHQKQIVSLPAKGTVDCVARTNAREW